MDRRHFAATVLLLLGSLRACGTDTPDAADPNAPQWFTAYDGEFGTAVIGLGELVIVPDATTVRGLDRATGQARWSVPRPAKAQVVAASGKLAVAGPGAVAVLDPATGRTLWSTSAQNILVRQDGVYTTQCTTTSTCTLTAHNVADGSVRWKAQTRGGTPDAPPTGLSGQATATAAVVLAQTAVAWQALDATAGRAATGTIRLAGGGPIVTGSTIVDSRSGEDCAVQLTGYDLHGARRWSTTAHTGSGSDGACQAVPAASGIAATAQATGLYATVSANGRPAAIALATGKEAWRADETGVPVDAGPGAVLTRKTGDSGDLALYDLKSGRRLWTAPDPGLSADSASWASLVTDRLVAVSGATGETPYVQVYAADTGRQLARIPGWLAGVGDNWVATTHTVGGKLRLEMRRY